MNKKRHSSTANILLPPAFPWSGRQVFSEVRAILAQEKRHPFTFADLGKIMGVPKTTVFRWFEELEHSSIVGLFACLERLPATKRQDFVNSHCRVIADFEHPWLSHSPARVGKMLELLNKERGLSIIAGGTQLARTFVFNSLGSAYHQRYSNDHRFIGLDLIRPNQVVPLEFCAYIDGPSLEDIKRIVRTLWPRIMTTSARIVMLNGVWLIQDLRQDILRLAERTHVVLACSGTPEVRSIAHQIHTPIHLVTVFDSKLVDHGIRLNLRRIKTRISARKRKS